MMEEPTETAGEYKFTVRLPVEMKERLRKMAELATKVGLIPKPDLVDLTNLALTLADEFIKQEGLKRMGYR